MLFDLTAPSDGTLAAYLTGAVGLLIDNVPFDYAAPFAGTIPVVSGRTYRVTVYSGQCWEYVCLDTPFVLTTTLFPPGAAVPIGCRMSSPVSGWLCINGEWIPPDHPEALATSPAPPAPPAPAPPSVASTCVTPQPVLNWVCINGEWIPPDHPEAIASAGLPPPPPPAPPVPPAPPPPPAPANSNCITQDPFVGIPGLYGVCVGTEWYPIGHPLAPSGVAIMGVQPSAGTIARWVKIFGVGFQSDTKVTFGGVPATEILLQSGGLMFALAPPNSAGPVDIAIQNTSGLGAALAGAYTYHPITVSVTPHVVSSGGDLIVTWTAPPGPYWYDWIGLYKVGDPNGSYISYEYTNGTTSGSLRFRAPLQPGWYEFRYLTNDDYYDAARTLPITVIGGSLQ